MKKSYTYSLPSERRLEAIRAKLPFWWLIRTNLAFFEARWAVRANFDYFGVCLLQSEHIW
jgi:hypothetical protein